MHKLSWIIQNSFERFKEYYEKEPLNTNEVIVEAIGNTGSFISEEHFEKKINYYEKIINEAFQNTQNNNFSDFEDILKSKKFEKSDNELIREITLGLYGYYLQNGY
jgi:hypothetical protein